MQKVIVPRLPIWQSSTLHHSEYSVQLIFRRPGSHPSSGTENPEPEGNNGRESRTDHWCHVHRYCHEIAREFWRKLS